MPPQSRANKRETISGYKGDLWREDSSIYKVTWHPLSSVGGQNASGLNGHKLGRMSELEFRDKYKWDGWHFSIIFPQKWYITFSTAHFLSQVKQNFFPSIYAVPLDFPRLLSFLPFVNRQVKVWYCMYYISYFKLFCKTIRLNWRN